MNMLRHYFISNSLDHLEVFGEQLEAAGVSMPQIHVLSRNDAEVEHHDHLHEVQSFMKNDIVHSTERGAVVGLCAFALVLAVAYYAGWTETTTGWIPFIFLAVVLLGYCTWEGGLLGIQKTQSQLCPFQTSLKQRQTYLFYGSRAPPGSGIGAGAKISPASGAGRHGIIRHS